MTIQSEILPAVLGGRPTFPPEKDISFPLYDEHEQSALDSVLADFLAGTPRRVDRIAEFEKEFAAIHDVRHAIAVSSCTAGLAVALASIGTGPGDEVIVTPFSFISSATSVLMVGAVPVFVDICPQTLCLDPAAVEAAITSRTKAILPVHIGGVPARMAEIVDIAASRGIRIIEDCAQAPMAKSNKSFVGTIGDAGVFSFGLSKFISSGEGGAIITNNDAIAEKCRALREFGVIKGMGEYTHTDLGWNYQISSLQAGILTSQLKKLANITSVRNQNGQFLAQQIGRIPGLRPVIGMSGDRNVYYMFMILLDESRFGLSRSRLIASLKAEHVPVCDTTQTPFPLYKNPVFSPTGIVMTKCPFKCQESAKAIASTTCQIAENVYRDIIIIGHPKMSRIMNRSSEEMTAVANVFSKLHYHADQLNGYFDGPKRECAEGILFAG